MKIRTTALALVISVVIAAVGCFPHKPAGPQPLAGEFLLETFKYNLVYAVNGGGGTNNAFTTVATDVTPFARFKLWPAGPQNPQYEFISTAKGYSVMARDGGGHDSADAMISDLVGYPYGEYINLAKFRFSQPDGQGVRTIQTSNGDFVTAVGGGGQLTNALHTDARVAKDWEHFRVVKCGDLGSGSTYAIHVYASGATLHALSGGGLTDHATFVDGSGGDSSRFRFLRQPDGSYALQTANGVNFLTAVGGGQQPYSLNPFHTDATQVQAWEKFRIVDEGRCRYTIQTAAGGFVGTSPGDLNYFATDITNPDNAAHAMFELFPFDL